jgi:hypothetical protein
MRAAGILSVNTRPPLEYTCKWESIESVKYFEVCSDTALKLVEKEKKKKKKKKWPSSLGDMKIPPQETESILPLFSPLSIAQSAIVTLSVSKQKCGRVGRGRV